MKNKMIALVAVMMMLAGSAFATNHALVDVYVTPGVTASLSAPTSFYNFGIVNVTESAASATAVVLQNDSASGVTLEKTITDSAAGGTIVRTNAAPDAINEFRLRSVQNVAAAVLDDDFSVVHTTFSTTLTTYNPLTDTTGTQVSLAPGASCNVWFQIDMPATVDNMDQRQFDLTYRATLQ